MKPPTPTTRADPASPEAWPAEGYERLRAGRYVEAARLLGRVLDPDAVTRRRALLARNLAALAEHRSELLGRIDRDAIVRAAACDDAGEFVITQTPMGLATLTQRPPNGPAVSLSPGNDPRTALAQTMHQLEPALDQRLAIGVYGVGDGYLLSALADRDAPNPLGQLQCVHVIAERVDHLLAAMSLHDYAGPRGPIAQPRIRFYLGGDWANQLATAFAADPMLPFPATGVSHGSAGAAIGPMVQKLAADVAARMQQMTAANQAYYATLDRRELAALFGEDPPRPPRVLAITSRFTTVLQHSSRDSLRALERLGWEPHLIIEPDDHHQITPASVAAAIARFKPDLVFLIDHLRYEYGDRFPPQLPMVCWIQDHLPNLTSPTVGPRVQARDYVLTAIAPRYARQSNYPPRQMIDLPKLTRVPDRPAAWDSDGDDLVYVSNASQSVAGLTDQTLDALGDDPAMRRFVGACCDWIAALYEKGESLPTFADVRRVVGATAEQTRTPLAPDGESTIVQHLHASFNSALYRQQALRWARDIAADRGLSLAIYGGGWERHDEFADCARGPVAYGPELEELTRRTKINLQIVPFLCTHQRLLDGLVAGGFFLVRTHPWDALVSEVAAYLDAHAPGAETVEALRAAAPGPAGVLDDLLNRAATLADIGYAVDLVEQVRCYRRARQLDDEATLIPRLDEVSFDDADGLAALIDRYSDDAGARADVARVQRESVERRLTYTAGLGRAIQAIGRLLTDEPD